MKKLAAALALGAVLMTAGAAYGQQMMQAAFGNTLVITGADGQVVLYHFNADNTYDLVLPDGRTIPGTYAINGNQICLTPAGGQQGCTDYVGDKNVGDTWTQHATDGSTISITLRAGR
ncbi:hypothetical protein [Terricaulis sp.]|uniref:hypothetical protein n=1 Tax=Terricaulis sp. TaxID=2768686 RepID=UPI0037842E1B